VVPLPASAEAVHQLSTVKVLLSKLSVVEAQLYLLSAAKVTHERLVKAQE